ncbi:hypothetical protein F5B21DRAFT_525975 [Xylaria acuta]|nr:hypothetical protein F5B21DRAFT_525975 [Xylaria acuta]
MYLPSTNIVPSVKKQVTEITTTVPAMENSSDNMGSSPSFEESPPSLSSERGPKAREWSQFELDTVCALICKHEHRRTSKGRSRGCGAMGIKDSDEEDWALQFATKLNEALHGVNNYRYDIPVADVCELMGFIETKNQLFMAYISRQSTPFRITRSKKYAFQRLCSDFNNAFYKWAVKHRERRQNTNIGTDQEISRLNSFDRDLSSPNEESHLLGAAHIRNILDAGLSAPTERGWISNSIYAERNREGPNSSTSGSNPKTYSPRRPILPAKPTHRGHRNQRGIIPPPPPPPSLPQPTQYEQINVQQSDLYNITSYEGTSPAYYGPFDPTLSASPYPPTSPAYFGRAELRQSIHPMGPRPETPIVMASPAYQYYSELQQNIYPMNHQLDAPGSLTSPVHDSVSNPTFMGYQYPDLAQENGNFDYGSVLETPASPSSPMHIPDAVPAEMIGTQTMEEPTPYSGELLEQPNFNLNSFNCGEYSLNCWP